MKILYQTAVTAVGDGRGGEARSHDGRLQVELARPPELGGQLSDPGTNPEQLFAAGFAACFHSALRTSGRRARVDVEDSAVTARVALARDDAGHYTLDVELVVELPGATPEQAEAMVAEASTICPYSRAIRGNVEVRRFVKS